MKQNNMTKKQYLNERNKDRNTKKQRLVRLKEVENTRIPVLLLKTGEMISSIFIYKYGYEDTRNR